MMKVTWPDPWDSLLGIISFLSRSPIQPVWRTSYDFYVRLECYRYSLVNGNVEHGWLLPCVRHGLDLRLLHVVDKWLAFSKSTQCTAVHGDFQCELQLIQSGSQRLSSNPTKYTPWYMLDVGKVCFSILLCTALLLSSLCMELEGIRRTNVNLFRPLR